MDDRIILKHKTWVSLATKEMLVKEDAVEIMESFEDELEWVRTQAEVDAWDAYSSLMTDAVLFNRIFTFRIPGWVPTPAQVQAKLKSWVNAARAAVEAVARALSKVFNVSGYSVGAGFPMGVSVSISFTL